MTTTAEAIERINEALEWINRREVWCTSEKMSVSEGRKVLTESGELLAETVRRAESPGDDSCERASFIAACNPEAIGAIIASHAALLEALRNFTEGCSTAVDAGEVARAAIQSATQSTKESA